MSWRRVKPSCCLCGRYLHVGSKATQTDSGRIHCTQCNSAEEELDLLLQNEAEMKDLWVSYHGRSITEAEQRWQHLQMRRRRQEITLRSKRVIMH